MNEKPQTRRYTLGADEGASDGTYNVVAAMENCSPLDLPPFAETVDPDALDSLLAGETTATEVSFDYCGYEVTATPDEVRVEEPVGENAG